MVSLTEKERETLLILFKDFTGYYNANSISKVLGISHVGAQKIFKRLLKGRLVTDQKIGKAIIYRPRLEDDYVCKLISFLLADEANNIKRWKEEFKGLFKNGRIVMMYGSAIKNYEKARDIETHIAMKSFRDSKEKPKNMILVIVNTALIIDIVLVNKPSKINNPIIISTTAAMYNVAVSDNGT